MKFPFLPYIAEVYRTTMSGNSVVIYLSSNIAPVIRNYLTSMHLKEKYRLQVSVTEIYTQDFPDMIRNEVRKAENDFFKNPNIGKVMMILPNIEASNYEANLDFIYSGHGRKNLGLVVIEPNHFYMNLPKDEFIGRVRKHSESYAGRGYKVIGLEQV